MIRSNVSQDMTIRCVDAAVSRKYRVYFDQKRRHQDAKGALQEERRGRGCAAAPPSADGGSPQNAPSEAAPHARHAAPTLVERRLFRKWPVVLSMERPSAAVDGVVSTSGEGSNAPVASRTKCPWRQEGETRQVDDGPFSLVARTCARARGASRGRRGCARCGSGELAVTTGGAA